MSNKLKNTFSRGGMATMALGVGLSMPAHSIERHAAPNPNIESEKIVSMAKQILRLVYAGGNILGPGQATIINNKNGSVNEVWMPSVFGKYIVGVDLQGFNFLITPQNIDRMSPKDLAGGSVWIEAEEPNSPVKGKLNLAAKYSLQLNGKGTFEDAAATYLSNKNTLYYSVNCQAGKPVAAEEYSSQFAASRSIPISSSIAERQHIVTDITGTMEGLMHNIPKKMPVDATTVAPETALIPGYK